MYKYCDDDRGGDSDYRFDRSRVGCDISVMCFLFVLHANHSYIDVTTIGYDCFAVNVMMEALYGTIDIYVSSAISILSCILY